MTSLPEVAEDHAAFRRRLALAVADEAGAMWLKVEPGRIRDSWLTAMTRLLVLLTGAQRAVAGRADTYLDEVLDAQDVDPAAEGRVSAAALSGIGSSGRNLTEQLYRPVITTLIAIQGGAGAAQALAAGSATLDMIVRTQVADAGRAADLVAMTARRQATGYVRMLVGRSCARCAILAGRRYAWSTGFRRHPRCFPAGVTVSGPSSEAATRRLYQGELVVLATASGQKLPLTGNHPVLTRRGWVPARLLQEGDEVVRSTRPEGASALEVPDHDQVPARIEDVWGSLGVPLLDAVEASPEDFHGDGQHSKVDVVRADGAFDDGLLAALAQHLRELAFALAAGSPGSLDRKRATELLNLTDAALAGRPVRFGSLRLALLGGLRGGPHQSGLAHSSALHSSRVQDAGDRAARDAVLLSQAVFAGPAEICSHDGVGGQIGSAPRWDAPGGTFSVETAEGYAARGRDLLHRLSGQVELDRVVEVRRVEWSGHVYSLTSAEGWHSANSLIVSNCDCIHIPAREDSADDLQTSPRAFFRSLDAAEQDRVFGKAGAEAIRAGADIAQVVNARRGMQTATVYGRRVLVTTTGTTTRGLAGQRLGARLTGIKQDGGRYRSATRVRLMPEQILIEANGNRAEAIRLLKVHGYLI